MKARIIKLFLFIGLVIGSFGISNAQSASEFRTHIPFDFTVGEKSFKAGDYSVSFAGLTTSQRRLIIRSKDGKQAALVEVTPYETIKPVKNPALVFNLIGNQYSLAELKTNRLSAELYKSKTEARLAQKSERVEVAMTK